VRRADFGLVPFGESSRQNGGLSFGKQSRLIDHRQHGVAGLVSLVSVRYTVARRDAADALDMSESQLGLRNSANDSETRPLQGGDVGDMLAIEREFVARRPHWLPPGAMEGMVRNYGTDVTQLLALAERETHLRRCFAGSHVSHVEAAHAVRKELAQRMTDIVFRRTELGTAGHPGTAALIELQLLLKRELGWSDQRAAAELAAVETQFERYLAIAPQDAQQVLMA
jgi:glycerol-3-phosphate dehydrogenase